MNFSNRRNGSEQPSSSVYSKNLEKQTVYETQLYNHLHNIAEFGKLTDIDSFDNVKSQQDSLIEEQFMRGLLMNFELLSDKWGLIDRSKYKYRHQHAHDEQNQLPKDTGFQHFFDIKTMKLALCKIYGKTFDNKKVLIEKEYALAGAKLI